MYTDAYYIREMFTRSPSCICVKIHGIVSYVPLDPNNTDYREIMRLVDAGELTIAEDSGE